MPREQKDKYPSKKSYKQLIDESMVKKPFKPDEIVKTSPPKKLWGDDTPPPDKDL